MKTTIMLSIWVALTSATTFSQTEAQFEERWKASELASRFFGPEKKGPTSLKNPVSLGAGINISVGSKIECGNLDVSASIKAEMARLDKQFGLVADQIKNISPTSLAVLSTCYYKPSLCSYIRHASVLFNEYLGVQVDACRAIDNYIDSQADKGIKQAKADAVANCIRSRGGNNPSTVDIRVCQSVEPATRNLLNPFKNDFVRKKQSVLKDTLQFVSSQHDYNILAALLGEVEIAENGYWRPLYPKGLLKGEDAVRNAVLSGEKEVCDLSKLANILNASYTREKEMIDYVKSTIRDHFLASDVRDIESLPELDRKAACHALGGGVATIALKRVVASGKASLSAAMTNPALNDDIRVFFQDRSATTFASILDEMEAKNYPALNVTLERMRELAKSHRAKDRESASGISAGTIQNEQNKKACDDEISCK